MLRKEFTLKETRTMRELLKALEEEDRIYSATFVVSKMKWVVRIYKDEA